MLPRMCCEKCHRDNVVEHKHATFSYWYCRNCKDETKLYENWSSRSDEEQDKIRTDIDTQFAKYSGVDHAYYSDSKSQIQSLPKIKAGRAQLLLPDGKVIDIDVQDVTVEISNGTRKFSIEGSEASDIYGDIADSIFKAPKDNEEEDDYDPFVFMTWEQDGGYIGN